MKVEVLLQSKLYKYDRNPITNDRDHFEGNFIVD